MHLYGSDEPHWSVLLTQLKADADTIKPRPIHTGTVTDFAHDTKQPQLLKLCDDDKRFSMD